jgi:hypothetical protein
MKASKNINTSSSSSVPVISPFFITGFVDAEGCFMLKIIKNNKCLIGYSVNLVFQIELHIKDRATLELIQSL